MGLVSAGNKHRSPETLSNLSAVIIDKGEIYIDRGAIHGKCLAEHMIQFVSDPDDVPNPRRVTLIWTTLRRAVTGLGIHGIAASVFYIDEFAGLGYKNLADQVNKLDGAVKGKIMLDVLMPEEHRLLGWFLQNQRGQLWENAEEAVWAQWLSPVEYAPLKAPIAEALNRREEIRQQVQGMKA